MDESFLKGKQEDIYSQAIRAGKRTYFFDVKATKSNEMYLTITESKRIYENGEGKYHYEKHKIFLFKEDFEKFRDGLDEVIRFITNGEKPEDVLPTDHLTDEEEDQLKIHSEVTFEDLN